MRKRLILSFILLFFSGLSIGSISWLEEKQAEIERLNEQSKNDLRELQGIGRTNQWLTRKVLPTLSNNTFDNEKIELGMISFYDTYASFYNFRVSQFIYYDTSAKMDIGFSFIPKNSSEVDRFLGLRYPYGYIQIKELSFKEGTLSGILTLIQPIKGENNAPSR